MSKDIDRLHKEFEDPANSEEGERQHLIAALTEPQQQEYAELLDRQETEKQQLKKDQHDKWKENVETETNKNRIVGQKTYLRPSNHPGGKINAPLSENEIRKAGRNDALQKDLNEQQALDKQHKEEEMTFLHSARKQRKKEHFQKAFNKIAEQNGNTKDNDIER